MLTRTFAVCAGAVLALAATAVGAVAFAGQGTWDPAVFAALLFLVVGATLVEIEFKKVAISCDFLGLIVAMALLGPTQAAILGVFSSIAWILKGPTRITSAFTSLAETVVFSFVGGVVMMVVADALDARATELAFTVPLAAGFMTAWALNVGIQFTVGHIIDGIPIWGTVRSVVVPLLPSEAAMMLLASIIVYAEAQLGVMALAMLIALLFLYMYLLRELVISQGRAEELEIRGRQLASLQVGVLTAMLRTLSMRDQMTARHSAAVARYARAIAQAAGCSPEEVELAHTAGLLHDIGKFILPDHILLADTKLDDEDWQLIKMHPFQGAKVVREVEGYGPVADIIWCHHERIDGRGYPRGLAGDEIPRISRMISIADTYDVMTARDSYRNPVSSAEAIAELRRVSGTQLDGELVEIFIEVLEAEDLAFQHTDDTDFETELAFERRVRDYAAPKTELPAAA